MSLLNLFSVCHLWVINLPSPRGDPVCGQRKVHPSASEQTPHRGKQTILSREPKVTSQTQGLPCTRPPRVYLGKAGLGSRRQAISRGDVTPGALGISTSTSGLRPDYRLSTYIAHCDKPSSRAGDISISSYLFLVCVSEWLRIHFYFFLFLLSLPDVCLPLFEVRVSCCPGLWSQGQS